MSEQGISVCFCIMTPDRKHEWWWEERLPARPMVGDRVMCDLEDAGSTTVVINEVTWLLTDDEGEEASMIAYADVSEEDVLARLKDQGTAEVEATE
jgi:hypothetical protein